MNNNKSTNFSLNAIVKRNAVEMLLIKGINIIISFMIVPVTINYVSGETYGLWLTLSSIVAWIAFFDIGITNGLKNKLAECIAIENFEKARSYISTTYALLSIIFIPILIVCLVINNNLNWNTILNQDSSENLNVIVSIILIYFCSNLILSTINTILIADLKTSYASFVSLLHQLITAVVIVILVFGSTTGSLLNLCLAVCIPPPLISLCYNIFLFKKKYRHISPSYKYIDFHLSKDLLVLGYKFFIIQIAFIVLFQTSNFIMLRYYGGDAVAQYNIAYKYFFTISMIFSIIIQPLWTAVSRAKTNNDIEWIRTIILKYTKLGFIFSLFGFILLLISPWIYDIWVGNSINKIPLVLSVVIYIYVCVNIFSTLYSTILNGASMLKLQYNFCFISPCLFFFFCYIFIFVLELDVYCIPLAIILSNVYGFIISPIQCYLVFFKQSRGIWIK